jgi:hypothetical protein
MKFWASGQAANQEDLYQWCDKNITQKTFAGLSIQRPPITPQMGVAYNMMVSGGTNGRLGDPGDDMLWVRGIARTKKVVEYIQDENDPDKETAKETTMTEIMVKTLSRIKNPDGSINTVITELA